MVHFSQLLWLFLCRNVPREGLYQLPTCLLVQNSYVQRVGTNVINWWHCVQRARIKIIFWKNDRTSKKLNKNSEKLFPLKTDINWKIYVSAFSTYMGLRFLHVNWKSYESSNKGSKKWHQSMTLKTVGPLTMTMV